MEIINRDGVHTTHCCMRHGCKYGAVDCPVEAGTVAQAYTCEQCEEENVLAKEQVEVIVANTVHTMCEWVRREIKTTEERAHRQLEDRNFDGFAHSLLRAQHYTALLAGMQEGEWKK